MTNAWRRPTKVLAATDLTANGKLALERAVTLSRSWGAELTVLHAFSEERLAKEAAADQQKRAVGEIEQQIKENPNAAGVAIHVITPSGEAAECILAKCDRLFMGLCVMGASRRTLAQRFLGTTIDNVLRQASQPVLCVRTPAGRPYRKIALATDFSAPSAHALDCTVSLFPDASITAIHAFDVVLRGLMPWDRFTGPLAEKHEREMAQGAAEEMRSFTSKMIAEGHDIRTVCTPGTPEDVLNAYVESEGIDLVVVGTHGRTGMRRLVLGSVAERLIAKLPCDVLAVPARVEGLRRPRR